MTTFNNEIIIVSDTRCGVTSAFNNAEEFRAAMIECGWTPEGFDAFMASDPQVYDAAYVCPTQRGGEIYAVKDGGRNTYYAVYAGNDVSLLMDLDHEAEPEELGEAGGILLMNPATGSVFPEAEWRKIYANVSPEEWGGQEFEDARMEEVVLNQPGQPGYDEGYGDWCPYGA